MTRSEKNAARKICDEMQRLSVQLQSLKFDMSDADRNIRDVMEALIDIPTTEELGPLPSFEEHLAFVRQSVNSGTMGM